MGLECEINQKPNYSNKFKEPPMIERIGKILGECVFQKVINNPVFNLRSQNKPIITKPI
jgi:hypothetical protein